MTVQKNYTNTRHFTLSLQPRSESAVITAPGKGHTSDIMSTFGAPLTGTLHDERLPSFFNTFPHPGHRISQKQRCLYILLCTLPVYRRPEAD